MPSSRVLKTPKFREVRPLATPLAGQFAARKPVRSAGDVAATFQQSAVPRFSPYLPFPPEDVIF